MYKTDRKMFDFKLQDINSDYNIKDYYKLKLLYLKFTLEDTLSDFELELNENEFNNILYDIFNEVDFMSIDDKIADKIKNLNKV